MEHKKTYTACYYKTDDGFVAISPDVEGANGQGDTLEEARKDLLEAIKLVIEYREEENKTEFGDEMSREELELV